MAPFAPAVMMTMESTIIFSRFRVLFRNRGERYSTFVLINSVIFWLLYAIIRLGFNTWITWWMWYTTLSAVRDTYLPMWQAALLLGGLTAGIVMQCHGFSHVTKTV